MHSLDVPPSLPPSLLQISQVSQHSCCLYFRAMDHSPVKCQSLRSKRIWNGIQMSQPLTLYPYPFMTMEASFITSERQLGCLQFIFKCFFYLYSLSLPPHQTLLYHSLFTTQHQYHTPHIHTPYFQRLC